MPLTLANFASSPCSNPELTLDEALRTPDTSLWRVEAARGDTVRTLELLRGARQHVAKVLATVHGD